MGNNEKVPAKQSISHNAERIGRHLLNLYTYIYIFIHTRCRQLIVNIGKDADIVDKFNTYTLVKGLH